MYRPKYYFIVANKTYICRPSGSESIRPDHSKDLVYYDPENPNDCLTEYETNLPLFCYFFILLPVIFILIGICFMTGKCDNKNNNNDNYTNVETNNTSDNISPTSGRNDFNDNRNYNNRNTSDYSYRSDNNINFSSDNNY